MDSKQERIECVRTETAFQIFCLQLLEKAESKSKNLLGDHSDLDPPDFHSELRSETN
jgi:hypothetical protein